jgi:hypothetical protein
MESGQVVLFCLKMDAHSFVLYTHTHPLAMHAALHLCTRTLILSHTTHAALHLCSRPVADTPPCTHTVASLIILPSVHWLPRGRVAQEPAPLLNTAAGAILQVGADGGTGAQPVGSSDASAESSVVGAAGRHSS